MEVAGKFAKEDIARLISGQLPFEPTSGQAGLIGELASFLLRFREEVGFVLLGYAGTGKTSVVSALVKALPRLNITPVLLSPTGRAAKVLASYSGHPAYTIHKQIYYSEPDEEGRLRLRLRKNRSRNTLYIVDEASMLGEDNTLLPDFFRYVQSGYRCRVLLVGDDAQLPPVGSPCSPALDAGYLSSCFPFRFFSFSLDEVVRQGKGSLVLENATALRQALSQAQARLPLFSLDMPGHVADLRRTCGEDMEELLQGAYGRYGPEGVVVITRSNRNANLFNKEIRNRIFGHESELVAGELLMVVKNNYYWMPSDAKAGFMANGDMLEVLKVKHFQEMYGFRFADVEVRMTDYPDQPPLEVKIWLDALHVDAACLPYDSVQELSRAVMEDYVHLPLKSERMKALRNDPFFNALQVKYAYALTCHKTQGGQWPCVFVENGSMKREALDKDYLRWLYTALTRAVKQAWLLGFPDEFFAGSPKRDF